MAEIKFALWNAEWFNELFSGDPPEIKLPTDRGYMTRQLIGERVSDLTGVINDIDSDIWVIVEGPNQSSELQLFFDRDEINGTWQCAVQPAGAQSVGLAVRTDKGLFENPPFDRFDIDTSPESEPLKMATSEFKMDTDGDGIEEVHKFERKPLYASVNLADGKKFRIVGLHLKSKGIFDSLEWSKWWAKADGNRKKIVAQCHQLRTKFLNGYLTGDTTKNIPLIVCGDINDGPGFDASEMKINKSGIERLMGSIWQPGLCLGNAIYDTLVEKKKNELDFSSIYTVSFADPIFNHSYIQVWLDHILYSKTGDNWVSGAKINTTMSNGNPIYKDFPASSDHRPVTCIINTDNFV
jgi:hypothetical protein